MSKELSTEIGYVHNFDCLIKNTCGVKNCIFKGGKNSVVLDVKIDKDKKLTLYCFRGDK